MKMLINNDYSSNNVTKHITTGLLAVASVVVWAAGCLAVWYYYHS